MTYTVYTPDTERGLTAYTQLQFTSLKDLARWAVTAALDEPAGAAPAPAPAPAAPDIMSVANALELIRNFKSGLDVSGTAVILPKELTPDVLLAHARDLIESVPLQADVSAGSAPTEDESTLWNIDTDTWFDAGVASEYIEPLRKRDWRAAAKIFIKDIRDTGFRAPKKSEEYKQVISTDDMKTFIRISLDNMSTVCETLFPESHVRWDLLPPAFSAAVKKDMVGSITWLGLVPRLPFTIDYFTVLRFFREGKRHSSWKDIMVYFGESEAADPVTLTNLLVSAWWSGKKASDEIREFMLKAVVLQAFENSKDASYIGGAEFLETYTDVVQKIKDLPAAFLEWATRGTSFKHCKKALGELGIPQARRAEGQRYTNIRLVSDTGPGAFSFATSPEPMDLSKPSAGMSWIKEDEALNIQDGYSYI